MPSLKLNNLLLIEESIRKISDATDTEIEEIIDGLVGIAWDEEGASELREFIVEALK